MPRSSHLTLLTVFRASALTLALLTAGLATAQPVPTERAAKSAPSLMLANVYREGMDLTNYWVSEKYDGVRGYWDGQQLLTRGGERVMAPAWFTAGWPQVPMDGELWAGRGKFAHAVSTVRQQTPDEDAWRALKFMVFDLPGQGGAFTERIPELEKRVLQINQPWVKPVAQRRVADHASLQRLLAKMVKDGGEGLMLHRGTSLYKGQRSDDLIKVKTHEDTEATVIGHVPGRGKYAGQLGALLVEMPAVGGKPAQRFKLGSGFTNADRRLPPAIGSSVTYRFRGLNDSGLPRFASFVRLREDRVN